MNPCHCGRMSRCASERQCVCTSSAEHWPLGHRKRVSRRLRNSCDVWQASASTSRQPTYHDDRPLATFSSSTVRRDCAEVDPVIFNA